MDSQLYNQLVTEYANMVFKIAYNYCKNKYDAEDIVQNTFLKLLQHKGSFSDDEHIKRWLIWRKRIVSWDESVSDAEFSFENNENSMLYDTVMSLDTKYRIVVHLYYYEGYSIREISEILHIKETTVQTRLMRARAKIKNTMKGDWLDE